MDYSPQIAELQEGIAGVSAGLADFRASTSQQFLEIGRIFEVARVMEDSRQELLGIIQTVESHKLSM